MNIMNQRHKKILEMYHAGAAFEDIGKATGYKETSVRSILSKLGVCNRRKFQYEKYSQIVKLYDQGRNNTQIALLTGVSPSTVTQVLKNYGIRRYIKHDAYEEDDIDTDTLQFAVERKPKFERVICNGKEYTDITDAIVGS